MIGSYKLWCFISLYLALNIICTVYGKRCQHLGSRKQVYCKFGCCKLQTSGCCVSQTRTTTSVYTYNYYYYTGYTNYGYSSKPAGYIGRVIWVLSMVVVSLLISGLCTGLCYCSRRSKGRIISVPTAQQCQYTVTTASGEQQLPLVVQTPGSDFRNKNVNQAVCIVRIKPT